MGTGRPPSNLPQTFEQMVASNEANKPKKPSRREMIEANKNEISMLVGDLAKRLEEQAHSGMKVNIQDTERVKQITLDYIRSCQITGTLPTISGIALACGYAPQSFKVFCRTHPEHDTSKWLRTVKEHFAELLNQAALAGDVQQIQAIFTLKASYNWSDQQEPEANDNSSAEELTPDAIAAKYDDLPD